MKKIKQNNYTFNSGKIANMRKTFKQKSISFLLVFLLAFQIIIGVLVPADISLFPPKLSIQETKAAGESWYDSNYTYRRAITIDHDQVATTTDAFPVLATTTQNYLKTTTNGGSVQSDSGHDIVFTDSDGQTLLNYEREKYSSSTGEIVYWINTDISSTSDKTIYMYYGNSSASDQATTTGVWDDNFVMVQHMNQTPTGTAPHMIDSTKYDNDGTASGTMTVSDQVAGQIDGSLDFDGGDDYIDVSPVLSINNLPIMTISMWVNTDSFGEDEQGYLLSKEDNGSSGFWAKLEGPYSAMEFRIDYDNIDLKAYSALGSFSSSDFNNWKYITITWDGTTNASDVHFYKDSIKLTHYTDGESDAIGSRVSDIGNNLYIGNKSFATRTFDGTIDEVRISNIVRHASWIKTEYNNQSDVASFLTFETQEDKPTENVFYSVSPFGTGDISNDSPSITIVDGVATLSQAQTGNIGTGVEIEYNSTKAYIAPNRIAFISGGTTELEPGTKIEGNTSGATGIIRAMETISGAWANGDATGWIYFEKTTGTFNASEQINRTKPTAVGSIVMTNGTIQGNIGNGNTEFVVKNATGATPTDQASTTVTSIHHVWGSLFDFEANFIGANYINNADLTATSTNVVAHAVCYYDHDDQTADVTAVDINFGTTSVDNYLQVYTPIGGAESLNKQRHNGTISSGYYIDPVAGGHGITNSASYSVFDGIRITDVESTYNKLFYNNAGEVTIKNCIFHDSAGASTDGVVLGAGYYNVYFYNNIIYNIVRYGLDVSGSVVSGYVYNNTVHNCAIGIYDIGAARTRLKNNISFGNSSSDYDDTAHADSTHNASDDGTAPNTNEITLSSFIVTDYFVSATDFHIDSSATYASEITDVGISLLNDSTKPFSADIDRQFHSSNIIWDIGADETATAIYRSVGPSKTTAVDDDNSNTETITIASGTATFSAVIADNVGVGDVILYDSSDDNNLTSADFIAFISARIDNQNYTIQTATGTSPADLSANDTWAIYRAYTSLANAESGTENTTLSDLGISYTGGNRDLVTNNEQWNIACYADAVDETAVIINDWTTGAQNYIKIYTPVLTSEVGISQRHNGVWDDGKYWSHNNDSATSMISIRDNYVRILGIQIQVTGTGINNRHGVRIDTVAVGGAEIYIDSMIIKGIFSGTGEGYGINNTSVNPSNVYIYNNLIYDFVSDSDIGFRGIRLHSGTNTYIYNNTIQNCYYGILRDGTTAYAKNNIVQNCTDGFSNGDFDPTSDYNISDVDQTDADHANATFDGYKTVKFIDLANNDFHLAPDDTVAIDAGTSTPGDSIASLQNDIDGDYRTQWDIGADEASIEFIGMVTEDDIGDNYSTLVSWETGMQTDLTATSTRVFSISGLVGTVSDISSVIGTSSGVTADVVHVSTTTNQILLENISGDFTDGEQLQVDGTNYVTITNLGNPAIAVARIDGAWTSADNNRVTISGWTTGEYNYIKIYTTDSARHNGKWDDGKYRMEVSMPGDGQRAIRVWEEYTRIDGLQIKMQSEYTSTDIVIVGSTWDSNNDFRISNSILQGDYTGNGQGNGISTMSSSKARGKIWNNIVYEITNGYAVTYRGWAYNNTAYNCSSGFNSNGYSPKGNIAQNCTNGFIGPFGASSDYNISDTSQADADDVNATFNGYKTVKFLDATNNDFHLHPDDTSAINAGTTTSALSSWSLSDRISLNYDIDGTLRGGAFDIGADEVPVEFISTICENTSAGGDCANLDYTSLGGTGDWEDKVECDLTASSTRVFSGTITGTLNENNLVCFLESGTSVGSGRIVATTSDQILIDNIISSTTDPLISVASGTKIQLDSSNYWTVQGATTTDDLGASPIAIAKIDGAWASADTNGVNINSWTTDNDNYIKIYTTDLARHDGKWNDNRYRIEVVGGVLGVYEEYVRVNGLQINLTGSSTWPVGIKVYINSSDSDLHILNNIIKGGYTTSNYAYGISPMSAYKSTVKIYNNIIYNFTTGSGGTDTGIYGTGNAGVTKDWSVYNNTIYNCEGGIFSSIHTLLKIKNNLIASTTYPFNQTFDSASDYNATDIDDTPSGGGSNNIINATIDFISVASGTEDFHLDVDKNSQIIDQGADLSDESYTPQRGASTDIDGAVRNPDDLGWDIGADEIPAKQYRSVGNISTDISSGGGTVTISSTTRTATFSEAQPTNIGVGDVIQYGSSYQLAFIISRASSTEYGVQAYDTKAPTATSSADFTIYRAHLELNDWEDQLVAQVNTGIDDTVDDLVLVNQDLVASNTTMMVSCYASTNGDDVAATIDDWDTNAQSYIKVFTPVSSSEVGITQRHGGKWDDSKYRIESITSKVFSIEDDYTMIDGLQMNLLSVGANNYGLWASIGQGGTISITNNIFKGSNDGYGIIQHSSSLGTGYIYNNIIYNFSRGFYTFLSDYVYNNTIINNTLSGIGCNNAQVIAKNNIVQGSANGYYVSSLSDNNISDTSQTDADEANATFSGYRTVNFIDSANNDFHLSPSDTSAIDAGTSTAGSFADAQDDSTEYDIDGDYRRTYDIGADEASVEFVSTVMETGGDFSSLVSWETANQADLTATTTAVFTCSSATGTIPIGSTITGTSSESTGTLVLYATSSSQILLTNMIASTSRSDTESEFIVGEKLYIQGGSTTTNYCIIQNAGNPAISVAKIDGAWTSADNNAVMISGWETGEYNYVKIYTADDARHNGKWDDSKYRIDGAFSWNNAITVRENFVRIDGLQLKNTTSNGTAYVVDFENYITYLAEAYVSNNIFMTGETKWSGLVFSWNPTGGNDKRKAHVWNNIFTDVLYGVTFGSQSWKGGSEVYNNTFYNLNAVNNGSDDTMTYKNNIAQNCTASCYATGNYNAASSNNISSDGTAPGTNSKSSTTVKFLDATNNDFHLHPDDTVARNAGTSSVVDVFDTPQQGASTWYDIDGTLRGGAFDIGADEVPVEFISTICENTSAGGDCANLDYTSLGGAGNWEDKVECDLTASSTRVFSGIITGTLNENDLVCFLESGTSVGSGRIVATTSDQILIDNIISSTTDPLISVASGTKIQLNSSNYWTVQGATTTDELGASPIAIAKIDGAWTSADTDALTILGWTTDNDNYIKIYTTDLARHDGKWDNMAYRRSQLFNNENYFRIDGVQIDSEIFNIASNIIDDNNSNIYVSNNIIRENDILTSSNSLCNLKIWNNILYNGNNTSYASIYLWSKNASVYNNTIYNDTIGIRAISGIVVAKNNLVSSTTNPYLGTFATGTDYNATDLADDIGEGSHNLINQTFNFISTASGTEDFHLASNDTGAKDLGADLSNDSYLKVIDDIDGQGRIHSSDIGADETAIPIFRSVGPSNTTALDTGASGNLTIEGLTATFATAVPDNVGVGDVIQYDSDNDGTVDALAFIHKRSSSTEYKVLTASGTPATEVSGDADWSIFRAYTSLSLAEEGTENTGINASLRNFDTWSDGKDLVTSNEQWNIACYGDAVDTTYVTINDWTTGEYNYIKIYTPVDSDEVGVTQRHSGKWDDNKYRLEGTVIMGIYEDYVKIDGLQSKTIVTGGSANNSFKIYTLSSGNNKIDISNNIIVGIYTNETSGDGIRSSDVNNNVYIYNNIIYGFTDPGWSAIHSYGTNYVYNNTIYDSYQGIFVEPGGLMIAKNNITQNCTNGYRGTFDSSSDNNISDVDQTDANDVNATFDGYKTVKFIDLANNDFHLAPDDTVAIDAGTSTPGDSIASLQNDIDGDYRTQWDIGADEAAVEFIGMVTEDDIGDNYSTLASWETGMQTDLTATSTRVFSISGLVGTVSDISSITGVSSGETAEVVHVSTTTNQILLENITGDFTDGEQLQVDGANYVTITNLGNPAIVVAKIDGAWSSADNSAVTISGWETGEYNYVKVYTTDSARHDGKWDDGKYRLEPIGMVMSIYEPFVRIDGLQMYQSTDLSARYGLNVTFAENDSDIYISNNIIKGTGNFTTSIHVGINIYESSIIWNNVIYGFTGTDSRGIWARATDKTHYIFNNTIYNSTNCIERLYATVIAKNNITQNCTDGFVDTFSSDSDNNISDLAGDAPGDNSKNSATVAFIDVDNSDFHLALSDTVARNAGTSSVVDVFDTPQRDASTWYDIDGTSRGGAFDIGADEAATEFVSTIMESGGDYDSLFDWEAEVNSDLMASGTLVYSGSITGSLANGNSVTLYRSGVVQNVIGTVVATTSSQILLENIIVETSIYSVSSSQIAQNGDEWRVDASNLWTVSGTGDQLGAPVIATAKIDGAWSNPDNTAVTIDGWETGVGNYIKIYTTDSARHNGKWSDVDYRLETIITAIVIQENYFKADGLQMKITNTDIRDGFLLSNLTDTSQMTLSNNIIKSVNTTGRGVMINSIEGNNHVGFIFNNIFINYPIGIYQNEDQYTLYAYNNTVYNATSKGFYRAQGTFVAKNNITQNCADGFVGTFTNSDFNLSDIAGDAPGSNSQNGATVTFVSTSTEDFHLAQADTSARKKGVNLTSDTNLAIVDDIDGEERPWPTTGLFDIGADQFHGQEVVIGGSPDSTVDLDNGLVGHWTFNEGSGNTVHDKSGNGNDGAWNGTGEHWEDIGRFGTGGKFNGDDDYVLVDDSDSLDTPSDNNAITICAWVNPDLLSYKDEIVTKQNDVSSDYSYGLKVYGAGSSVYSGSIRYSSSCDGSTETTYNFTDKTFSTGVWTNICVVSDGSIIKAYVDASQSSNTYTPLSCIYENAVDLTFGATAAFNGDFDGKIDEVRIYNRALSQREIAELYNQGKASSEWHFRNNLNETGTLCKLGQCKNLTGNGDYSFTTGYLEESITSLSLSGAGYASLADDDYFDIASTSDFSWLATIKTSDTGSSTIISKRTNNSASNAGYLFGLDYGKGDGIPYFEVSDGTNEFSIYGSTNIADNKWHTIITVFDEDSSAGNKIYIDGVNSTGGSLGTLGFLGSLGNSVALNVGRNNDDTGLFTGSIDRIAFLPYALTRNDVLRENANSYSVQIGQQTKDTSSGVNYDPFGGAPPVAWWKLNEMSGSVAKDYASSSLNGTWNGTGNHFKNGKVGMGGNFNGTDDYVDLGSDPIIKTTQFTIGAWAKMSGQGGGSDGDNIIFEQRDASTGDNHSSIILFSEDYSSNEVCFKVRSSVGLTDSASYATPANYNEWHYYIGVVDSSFIYLYIDGVEVSKVANTQTGNYITGLDFIDIGRHRYSSSNAGMFNGCIDDVKIYDYARTQAQIAWDYNRGKPIAHWKFDEASSGDADGATLIDSSDPPAGGAYNGTGSSTGSGLDYVSGKFGSALDFDGADDFVGIGDLDVVDNASQLSVCSWVYHDGLSWDQYIAMNGSDAGFRFFKDTVGSSARTDMYRIIVKETGGTTAYIESESDTAILQQWRHVCFTYTEDSLNGLRLYINGLEDPNSPVDTSGIIDIDSGVEEFAISSNSGNSEFNGKIDDVRVYNYVLSESMIKEVYNNGRVRFGE